MNYIRQFVLFKFIVLYFFHFTFAYSNELIILNSIPKAGTHLAMKCICLLTQKHSYAIRWNPVLEPSKGRFFSGDDIVQLREIFSQVPRNEFISSHLIFSSVMEDEVVKKGYKFIFIYRDPRAQVVSMARWKMKFNANNGMNLNESIMSLIKEPALYKIGWDTVGNISELYASYMPWALNSKFLAVRFEDLVGSKGGGDAQKQYQTVQNIADFLGLKLSAQKIHSICLKIFGETSTFNEGQIDGWKKYFTNEHKKAFKKYAGKLLIGLGYEKNLNW